MKRQSANKPFSSKLEDRKKGSDEIIQLLEQQDRDIYTYKKNILYIGTKSYKKLYTSDRVNQEVQEKLLEKKLSKKTRDDLDAAITFGKNIPGSTISRYHYFLR